MTDNINEILKQRAKTHGDFRQVAKLSQNLKMTIDFFIAERENAISTTHKEALDMIFSKIARICVGNPNEIDHWRDIAGYALLVVRELESENDERK